MRVTAIVIMDVESRSHEHERMVDTALIADRFSARTWSKDEFEGWSCRVRRVSRIVAAQLQSLGERESANKGGL